MKNRLSARPARRRKPSDERARLPGNRLSAKVSSRAPNAAKMRAVLSGCPGRSEFAANAFLTLCVMHNGARSPCGPSPTRGQTEFAACADSNPPNATIPTLRIAIQKRIHDRQVAEDE